MTESRPRPPAWLRRLLARVLGWDEGHLVAELDELYEQRVGRGESAARWWYARQVAWFMAVQGGTRLRRYVVELGGIVPDLRLAARTLRRRPAYAAAFAGTLALGIGALATVHAAAHHVLLRPVPGVVDESSLVTLRVGSTVAPPHISWDLEDADLQRLGAALTSVQDMAGVTALDVNVVHGGGRAQRMRAQLVSASYLRVLGTELLAGAFPWTDAADELVVSHGLAEQMAGTAPGALGAELKVNGRAFRVTGVTPRGFRGAELPGEADLWLPAGAFTPLRLGDRPAVEGGPRRPVWGKVVARLAPSASVAGVQATADALVTGLRQEGIASPLAFIDHFRLEAYEGVGLEPGVRAVARRTLRLLAGAAAFLLLIAMANVGSLGLAHAAAQRSAHALRRALGAGRVRLVRQLLAEAVLLGVAGALGGLVMAHLWSGWLGGARLARTGASLAGMGVSPVVAAVALGLAVAVSLAALLLPALRAAAVMPLDALRSARHGDVAGQRIRSALVAVQAAAAVALLVGAALLLRTVSNLTAVPLGTSLEAATVFRLDPGGQHSGAEKVRILEAVERGLRNVPGVTAAGLANHGLFSGGYITNAYADRPEGELSLGVAYYEVTPGFLEALAPQRLAGELRLGDADVVVSRSLAEQLFPGVAPGGVVGMPIYSPNDNWAPRRVAGVVADIAANGWYMDSPRMAFTRFAPGTRGESMQGWIRAPGVDRARMREAVERVVDEVAGLPVFGVQPAAAAAAGLHAERNVLTATAVGVGVLGLLLTAVGLYGVLAYMVVERRREIGVRAALGAAPAAVLTSVVQRGLSLALTGGVVGLGGALVVSRLLRSQLYGLHALDTASYLGGILLLLAVAFVASYLPARRATRVDPMEVLRTE